MICESRVLRWVLTLFLLTLGDTLTGQAKDSLLSSVEAAQNVEFLYQLLLEQTESQLSEGLDPTEFTSEESYEDLLEDYLFYLENPININSDEAVHLEEIGLLSVFQMDALRQYRWQFGDLMFADELLMLDGFNETVVAVIAPLVYFGKNEQKQGRSQHQLTANYAEKFGDTHNDDFLGSPRKIQLKYAYNYKQKMRFGIVAEKDAGEPYFNTGFDFYGAHFYRSGSVVKDLALGDYQLSFGQGLTLWSGMSFGKASGGSSVMKRASGVKPKASASEGKFFRGAATTLSYNDFYVTAFYSIRNIDATVAETDTLDDPELVSALQETGYHRTLNELSKKNAIRQQVFGGHLSYAGPDLEVGCTIYHLMLSAPLELKPSKYNQFYFQGDRLTDMGFDFRWLIGKTAFFGELSRSDNGAMAGLVGMTMKPKGYINFTLLYRNYDKRYQSFFNGAFSESSRGQGEEGVYLGIQCAPAPKWDIIAYTDFFRLTWLSSQVYNPSWGQEYSLKVSHQISRNTAMQMRFKAKTKMKNSTNEHVFSPYPIFYTKRNLNFQISYNITDALTFSDKIAYSHYFNDDGADSRGYVICHDIAYKPPEKPYSLTFRYALFDSDDYNSRITVYENDVLGAFSIPSMNGRGTRAYLLGKIKLFNRLSIYTRIGGSFFSDQTKIDLKTEIILKL